MCEIERGVGKRQAGQGDGARREPTFEPRERAAGSGQTYRTGEAVGVGQTQHEATAIHVEPRVDAVAWRRLGGQATFDCAVSAAQRDVGRDAQHAAGGNRLAGRRRRHLAQRRRERNLDATQLDDVDRRRCGRRRRIGRDQTVEGTERDAAGPGRAAQPGADDDNAAQPTGDQLARAIFDAEVADREIAIGADADVAGDRPRPADASYRQGGVVDADGGEFVEQSALDEFGDRMAGDDARRRRSRAGSTSL